jgi:hypothetical protein
MQTEDTVTLLVGKVTDATNKVSKAETELSNASTKLKGAEDNLKAVGGGTEGEPEDHHQSARSSKVRL